MKLRELMKMYDLKLEIAIIESQGKERVSVTLRTALFRSKESQRHSFPGWGTNVNAAISDLLSQMREQTHIILPQTGTSEERVVPLPPIYSFS